MKTTLLKKLIVVAVGGLFVASAANMVWSTKVSHC